MFQKNKRPQNLRITINLIGNMQKPSTLTLLFSRSTILDASRENRITLRTKRPGQGFTETNKKKTGFELK